jgi:cyclopropane-fatty-acyl-phospholipid synthase
MFQKLQIKNWHTSPEAVVGPIARLLVGRFANHFRDSPTAFNLILPDGSAQPVGRGAPSFRIHLKTNRALRALASIDSGRIGDAYVAGDLDIDGDMLKPFELRNSMGDVHPLITVWRFLQPALFGQLYTNKDAISAHYDIDPGFFLSFLDPETPCYTQGVYADDAETLAVATLRKFDYVYTGCRLKPGAHILEVGPGWGAWFEYAWRRGVKCTGITISQTSADYLRARAALLGADWEILMSDLLAYQTERKYDAVVIMGVMEHLPQYKPVLEKLMSVLKPGGRLFIDASACTKKFELSSYMVKYIYGGNHSFLVLHDFLEKLAQTPMRVVDLFNDRYSYFLTFQQWARNFDQNQELVIERFGEFNYRRFRLYLWGAAYEFLSRSLDCYRMIIHNPEYGSSDKS